MKMDVDIEEAMWKGKPRKRGNTKQENGERI